MYSSTLKGPWQKIKTSFYVKCGAEDVVFFSCNPAHDLGYSGPVSPNCPNIRVPVRQIKFDPQKALILKALPDVKCGAEDFGLLLECPCT